jgi:hypothetical protein
VQTAFQVDVNINLYRKKIQHNMLNNTHKLFIRFLKEEKCYLDYINNLLSDNFSFINLNPEAFISQAFTWCFTKEGYSHWVVKHEKWRNIYDNFKRNNKKI